LALDLYREKYSGKISEVVIGLGRGAVKIGGQTCMPFYNWEGETPNPPQIAFGIWDADTEKWPEPLKEPYQDVLNDPAKWALKDVSEFGAEILCLRLQSTDPNGKNAEPESVLPAIEKILKAVEVPLIVSGVASPQKDASVLAAVAQKFEGKNLLLWPAEQDNYKQVAAAAMAFKHKVAASTPIDVNLAKQLNILIENLGLKSDQIVMDPTTAALGYGIEYCCSVMERDRLAVLVSQDEKMQKPMINFVGQEVWKIKELNQRAGEDSASAGEKAGIIYEAITAGLALLAGSDLVVMLHPQAISYTKKLVAELLAGC